MISYVSKNTASGGESASLGTQCTFVIPLNTSILLYFFTFLKQQNALLGHTQGIFLKTNTHIINDFRDISAT